MINILQQIGRNWEMLFEVKYCHKKMTQPDKISGDQYLKMNFIACINFNVIRSTFGTYVSIIITQMKL